MTSGWRLESNSGTFELQSCTYLVFALNKVEKLAALRVLQHDENVAARVNKLEVLDDMRVIEPSKDFDLTLNLLKDTLQFDFALVQDFDCDFVVCDLVYGHCN